MFFLNLQEAIDRAYRIAQSSSPYADDHRLIHAWLTEHLELEAEISRLRSMLDCVISHSGCPICRDPSCEAYSFEDWKEFLISKGIK